MTSLMNKIEQLIKREKTTPERKKNDDSKKSSNEILSELFSVFNADPPKIDENSVKKAKKSKKKHKKEKKKRSRSSSSSNSDSDDSEYTKKRKKRKKSKTKKRKESPSRSPPIKVEKDKIAKLEKNKIVKAEKKKTVPSYKKSEDSKVKIENAVKLEPKEEAKPRRVSIKLEDIELPIETCEIPLPDSPRDKYDSSDLRHKIENKKSDSSDGGKGSKIQIKNLKFSTVFEETVKKAEEEARKKKEKYEEGEYTDSSSSSVKEEPSNSEFPKSADPGGILKTKAAVEKQTENEEKVPRKSKHSEKDKSRSPHKSKSKKSRSRSRSGSRKRRHRSRSRSRRRSRSRHRSKSHSRSRSKYWSGRQSPGRHRSRRSRERTASGVKLADHEKKRLLEVARRNAINMLKNGAVPAGAAALPPHTRNQVMAAIQSGGKSVDELTDFCKHLSKKEALGELSSVGSSDEGLSENEDTLAFHHPFLVKEKAPIVMNIRGGAPLPIKSSTSLALVNKDELRLQFPVSSGTQHREKAIEWVPVETKKDNMQVAKLGDKSVKAITQKAIQPATAEIPLPPQTSGPLALPAPPPVPVPEPPLYMQSFTSSTQLSTVQLPVQSIPALPPPGPQAYPPGIQPTEPVIDVAQIVSQKLLMIRKEQEENELSASMGFGWSKDKKLGQFTGSTGAQILTPRELASGTQAWVKKDQLVRAAPVEGGMGMHLLQKMGWQPGKGLGKEGTGTLQPLLLEVKLDTRGLQAKEEAPTRNNRAVKSQRPGVRRPPGGGGAAPLVAGGKHPVSLLGEYCSKQKLGPPEYSLCFECGPDHKKNFLFRVKVATTEYQPAVASANKKQAKADAAQLALQKLGILP